LLALRHRAADDGVVDAVGSMPGACATTDFSTWASMSSGRVLRNTPLGALPTGVRVAATM
jgi:hypothetical protein